MNTYQHRNAYLRVVCVHWYSDRYISLWCSDIRVGTHWGFQRNRLYLKYLANFIFTA